MLCLFVGLRISRAVGCKLVSPKEGCACKTVAEKNHIYFISSSDEMCWLYKELVSETYSLLWWYLKTQSSYIRAVQFIYFTIFSSDQSCISLKV